jgi:hypothetical protein
LIETWRKLGLALLVFGIAGVLLELYLLEHFEDTPQWTPIALLGVGLLVGPWVVVKPGRAAVRALQGLMALYVGSGAVGIYFHLKANVEFELELHASAAGMDLVMESLRGAMPALAPGTMVQLGLLGLLMTFRHPALGGGAAEIEDS